MSEAEARSTDLEVEVCQLVSRRHQLICSRHVSLSIDASAQHIHAHLHLIKPAAWDLDRIIDPPSSETAILVSCILAE